MSGTRPGMTKSSLTPDKNKMRGMIVCTIISGANPISPGAIRMADRRGEAACARTLSAPRAGAFARAGKFKEGSDGGAL